VAVGPNSTNTFDPAQVDVAKGGTVTFNWNGVTHNVNWDSPPAQVANIGDRSSGSVPVTFGTSGTYNYHCSLHPGMNGVVTVH
jgi:plastocyanin